jgi:hypothetical protein
MSIASTAPQVASPQHDARGRFVKGNRGGPGNPLAGKVNKVRKAFLDYFEGPSMRILCDYMFRRALSGDPRFVRLILQYTIGKLPTGDGFDPGFADSAFADDAFSSDEAGARQAEAEALSELRGECANAAEAAPAAEELSAEEPAAEEPAAEEPAADEPAAGATSSTAAAGRHQEVERAGRDARMEPEVGDPAGADTELAAQVGTGVMEVPNPPRSKNRERLLRLLEERDPVHGDLWAIPPSTNGLGEARNIPLVGT